MVAGSNNKAKKFIASGFNGRFARVLLGASRG